MSRNICYSPLLQCVQTSIKCSTVSRQLLTTFPCNEMLVKKHRLESRQMLTRLVVLIGQFLSIKQMSAQ